MILGDDGKLWFLYDQTFITMVTHNTYHENLHYKSFSFLPFSTDYQIDK